MNKLSFTRLGITTIIIALVAFALSMFMIQRAYANPSQFATAVYCNGSTTGTSATTSFSWITAGNGTSTCALRDTRDFSTKYDKALVVYQVQATATPQNSKLRYRVERSWDGIDWYSDSVASTTVDSTGVMPATEFSINLATTTAYSNNPSATRLNGSFVIETTAPLNRVLFYSAVGGPNLSVWGQVTPIKEIVN